LSRGFPTIRRSTSETEVQLGHVRQTDRLLRSARELGASEVEVVGDSELIAKQVMGQYKVKNDALRSLHREASAALRDFERWAIRTVPRAQNADADALVNATLDQARAASSL